MVKDKTRKDSYLTDWDQHPGSEKSPTNIIPPSQTSHNPVNEFMQQKPLNFNDWLEELKRKRRQNGWF